MDLKRFVRVIPDFPKKGVSFKDITPLLLNPTAFDAVMQAFLDYSRPKQADLVASAEARGFIFGAAVARELRKGFIPIRKPGKLPFKTERVEFMKEYGPDAFELHADAIVRGQKVLIVDDVLATGGTAKAIAELVEKMGGKVSGLAFLIELNYLEGRKKLGGYDVYSVINYDC